MLSVAIQKARIGTGIMHASAECMNDLTMTLLVYSSDQFETLEAALHLISKCRADSAPPSERPRGMFLRHAATELVFPWGEVAQLIDPNLRCKAPRFRLGPK
jgi:hypothetical protein